MHSPKWASLGARNGQAPGGKEEQAEGAEGIHRRDGEDAETGEGELGLFGHGVGIGRGGVR